MPPHDAADSVLGRTDEEILTSAIGWKVASWKRVLDEVLRHLPGNLEGRVVLEIGGGAYGLNLLLSRLGCRVLCTDRRLDHGRQAAELHHSHGLACQHVITDARRLAFRPGSFDLVVMKSVLGGIYSQCGRDGVLESLASVRQALKPGGVSLILEQLEGDPLTQVLRRMRYPERRWHYFKVGEFTAGAPDYLMDGFPDVRWKALTLLSHNAEEWLSHRHPLVQAATALDRVFEPITPPDWKHLIGVVAMIDPAEAEIGAREESAPQEEAAGESPAA